jgi:hypothetical protein
MSDHPRRGSKLLIDEPPLIVLPSLAAALGLSEAILLQQIHYWLRQGGHVRDGRRWIYNSYAQWAAQLPFWKEGAIRRILEHLRARGLLLTGNYNASPPGPHYLVHHRLRRPRRARPWSICRLRPLVGRNRQLAGRKWPTIRCRQPTIWRKRPTYTRDYHRDYARDYPREGECAPSLWI